MRHCVVLNQTTPWDVYIDRLAFLLLLHRELIGLPGYGTSVGTFSFSALMASVCKYHEVRNVQRAPTTFVVIVQISTRDIKRASNDATGE